MAGSITMSLPSFTPYGESSAPRPRSDGGAPGPARTGSSRKRTRPPPARYLSKRLGLRREESGPAARRRRSRRRRPAASPFPSDSQARRRSRCPARAAAWPRETPRPRSRRVERALAVPGREIDLRRPLLGHRKDRGGEGLLPLERLDLGGPPPMPAAAKSNSASLSSSTYFFFSPERKTTVFCADPELRDERLGAGGVALRVEKLDLDLRRQRLGSGSAAPRRAGRGGRCAS